jgi:hypothetical protein
MGCFMTQLASRLYGVKWEDNSLKLIAGYLEGNSQEQIEVLPRQILGETEDNNENLECRNADVSTEIRTKHLPNTSLWHCRYSSTLFTVTVESRMKKCVFEKKRNIPKFICGSVHFES